MTYKLGLRYLFVDSLCIIQDDEGDERAQMEQMLNTAKRSSLSLLLGLGASRSACCKTGHLYFKISENGRSVDIETFSTCR